MTIASVSTICYTGLGQGEGHQIMTPSKNKISTVPTAKYIELAKEIASKIAARKTSVSKKNFQYQITDGKGLAVKVSESAFEILSEALKEMADGKAVMLTPIQAELTTQQAAELLNVSRPYLVNLLESGEIAFRNVGRYRRVKYKDILQYQKKLEKKGKTAMDELVKQAQELNLGY